MATSRAARAAAPPTAAAPRTATDAPCPPRPPESGDGLRQIWDVGHHCHLWALSLLLARLRRLLEVDFCALSLLTERLLELDLHRPRALETLGNAVIEGRALQIIGVGAWLRRRPLADAIALCPGL